jgi:hypothetical protein
VLHALRGSHLLLNVMFQCVVLIGVQISWDMECPLCMYDSVFHDHMGVFGWSDKKVRVRVLCILLL